MTRVAVSILNHNSVKSTIACIQSLLAAGEFANGVCVLELFISDNASGSKDRDRLQEFMEGQSNVNFRINEENLGFSVGHNRNLQTIFTLSNPEYIWVLNSDCIVAEESLTALVECARQRPGVGIWGATLLEPDGETIQCAGGCFYSAWVSSYRQYGRGKILAQIGQLEPVDYDYIAGASLFFPVATLQHGLRSVPPLPTEECSDSQQWLNESFFLYFEELDLAQRLKPGFGMAWCKGALIRHVGGVSTGTAEYQRSALAEYHSTLSALKFTSLYYPRRLWVMAPARYFSKCLLLAFRGEFRLIGNMTRAYWDFWTGK